MSEPVDRLVDEIRGLVAADGGDVTVVARDPSALRLALALPDEVCRECVLPKAMLEQIASDVARRCGANVRVTIDDPRDH